MRQRNLNTVPPRDTSYAEWLRYLVQSSDPEAGELPFLISLWNTEQNRGGLSEAQQAAATPYIIEADEFLAAYVYPRPAILQAEPDMTNVVKFPKGGRS